LSLQADLELVLISPRGLEGQVLTLEQFSNDHGTLIWFLSSSGGGSEQLAKWKRFITRFSQGGKVERREMNIKNVIYLCHHR